MAFFNQATLFLLFLIRFVNHYIVAWKAKAPEHRYKGENLFFFGQITSKLNTTSKTMTLICVTLVLAIFMRLFCVCEDSVCLAVPAAWGIDLDSLLSHGMS